MMNVLVVTNTTSAYGANRSLYDMIIQLKRLDVHFVVMFYEHGEFERILKNVGVQTEVFPYSLCVHEEHTESMFRWSGRYFRNLLKLKKAQEIIKKYHIDIIHSNASNVDFGALLAEYCHIPHVWHIRELLYADYHIKYNFPHIENMLLHRAEKVICISEFVQQKRNLQKKNCMVLYDGFDIDKYTLNKRFFLEKPKMEILYCGVISAEKGTSDCIYAVERLKEQQDIDVHLSIVGSPNEYWNKLEEYIQTHCLEDVITYYGYQKDMKPYREKADVAIISSRSEGLGRVTIESMLGEVLVIGTKSGANTELIKDGETGYLYEAGNIEQLADKIRESYLQKQHSFKCIQAAKEFAEQNFEGKQYALQIKEIYQECMRASTSQNGVV